MDLKPVCVITSWDDADRFTPKLARLLENYALRATFFVPVTYLTHGNITKEEIANLSNNYEIGSHSVTHSNLTKLPIELIRKEVSESKRVLEQIVGKRILCFSYPYGFFNNILKNEVKAAGYIAARTVRPYRIDENTDPFALPTTIQACPQTRISSNLFALAKISIGLVPVLLTSRTWNKLGRKLFDACLKRGGVFHLWGHSWEIEKEDGWNTLEDFFSYICCRKDASYLSMGEYASAHYLNSLRLNSILT